MFFLFSCLSASLKIETDKGQGSGEDLESILITQFGSDLSLLSNLTIVSGSFNQSDFNFIHSNCTLLSYFKICEEVNVTNQTIPENTFQNFQNLTTIYLGPIRQIEAYAFENSSLKNIEMASSVETILSKAFMNTKIENTNAFINLITLNVDYDIYTFGECHFLTSASLPKVTKLSKFAFYNCSLLSVINMPKLEQISSCAFMNDDKLTEFISSTVTSVGDSAFSGCDSLITVNLSGPMDFIGSNAFMNCTHLQNFSAVNAKSLSYPFRGCGMLTSLSFPEVLNLDGSAFQYCNNITSLYFPKLQAIEASAFSHLQKLSIIDVSSATQIEGEAFSDCPSLVEINLPSLVEIPKEQQGHNSDYIFAHCKNLKIVKMPKLAKLISLPHMFDDCPLLEEIHLPSIPPKTFSNETFDNNLNISLILPNPEDYKTYDDDTSIPGDVAGDNLWCKIKCVAPPQPYTTTTTTTTTSEEPPSSTNKKHNRKRNILIGSLVGGFVFLVIAIGTAIYVYKKKSAKEKITVSEMLL